jgi:hypothetical protein
MEKMEKNPIENTTEKLNPEAVEQMKTLRRSAKGKVRALKNTKQSFRNSGISLMKTLKK